MKSIHEVAEQIYANQDSLGPVAKIEVLRPDTARVIKQTIMDMRLRGGYTLDIGSGTGMGGLMAVDANPLTHLVEIDQDPDLAHLTQANLNEAGVYPMTWATDASKNLPPIFDSLRAKTTAIIFDHDPKNYWDIWQTLEKSGPRKDTLVFMNNVSDASERGGLLRNLHARFGETLVMPETSSGLVYFRYYPTYANQSANK